MYNGKKIVSIIPARGGSKGIPRKNIQKLRGKPLIAYSILQSLNSKYVDRTIVSTEDDEISKISQVYGAEIITRPNELAEDTTPTDPVILHALDHLVKENYQPDYVVLLQPTSPIRRNDDIDSAIKLLISSSGDSLLSVRENDSFLWTQKGESINYDYLNRPRRQDKDWEFVENGSIYITKRETLVNMKNRLGGKIILYLMPHWASYEIDTMFDFKIIEYIMNLKLPVLYDDLKHIKLVVFDVDGTFTDGTVILNSNGIESLRFSRIDGKGIELLRNSNIKTAVISSEDTDIIKNRMNKLKIDEVFVGIKNKLKIYEKIKNKYHLSDDEIVYCGDDINDIEVIQKVGFSACPSNAIVEIKNNCSYISPYSGGNGFIRDICNIIIAHTSDAK